MVLGLHLYVGFRVSVGCDRVAGAWKRFRVFGCIGFGGSRRFRVACLLVCLLACCLAGGPKTLAAWRVAQRTPLNP